MDCGDPSIAYFARRDLSNQEPGPIEGLWNLPAAKQILKKQLPQGCWTYANPRAKEASPLQDYDQLETYRRLGQLVEKYGMNKTHSAIKDAAEFLFGKQTGEGDFRGIYGNQYTPNYTGGITELLTKAGYGDDPRIEKAIEWLLSIRQRDGGWAIPVRTARRNFRRNTSQSAITSRTTLQPDLSRPSSHMVTGVVLRAFAAHRKYRKCSEASAGARLLPPRFFRRDTYVDRAAPEFWEKVSFPFWFTDIVSALDSLSLIGETPLRNSEVAQALEWLQRQQINTGLFKLKLLRNADPMLGYWLTLAIGRVLRRYSG